MLIVVIIFVLSMGLLIAGMNWVAWDAWKKGFDRAIIWVYIINIIIFFTGFTGLIIYRLLGE
jgi:hypothetical protein